MTDDAEIDLGFDAVLAGEVYKAPDEPAVTIRNAPPPEPHVCANATGGDRCDVCFGPVTATVSERQHSQVSPNADTGLTPLGVEAAKALINLPDLDRVALAKLAREIAMDIKERHAILKEFGLTQAQYDFLEANNAFYKNALEAACIEWHSPLSTKQRVSLSAAAILEDSLPGLGARMQNKAEGFPGVIEAAKFFAKAAGVGERENSSAAGGERFVINIDLGGDQKLVVEAGSDPQVVGQQPVLRGATQLPPTQGHREQVRSEPEGQGNVAAVPPIPKGP